MRKQRNRPLLGWILLILALAIIVAALFGLEYLGSEQAQRRIDQPVTIPNNGSKAG